MPRDVRIEVPAPSASALEEALAPCVSEAAVFIETEHPEPVGDRIRVSLVLASGEVGLSIVGTVAWVFPTGAAPPGRPEGMGILVEAGDDDSLARLDRVQQRGASSPLARIPGASFWRFSLPPASLKKFASLDAWRREGAVAPQQEWREESGSRSSPRIEIPAPPNRAGAAAEPAAVEPASDDATPIRFNASIPENISNISTSSAPAEQEAPHDDNKTPLRHDVPIHSIPPEFVAQHADARSSDDATPIVADAALLDSELDSAPGSAPDELDGSALDELDGGALDELDGGALNELDGGALDGGTPDELDGGALDELDGGALDELDGGALDNAAARIDDLLSDESLSDDTAALAPPPSLVSLDDGDAISFSKLRPSGVTTRPAGEQTVLTRSRRGAAVDDDNEEGHERRIDLEPTDIVLIAGLGLSSEASGESLEEDGEAPDGGAISAPPLALAGENASPVKRDAKSNEDVFAAAEADDGEDTDRTADKVGRGFDADEGAPARTMPTLRSRSLPRVDPAEVPPLLPVAGEASFSRPFAEGTFEDAISSKPVGEAVLHQGAPIAEGTLTDRAAHQSEAPEAVIHRMPLPPMSSEEGSAEAPVEPEPAEHSPLPNEEDETPPLSLAPLPADPDNGSSDAAPDEVSGSFFPPPLGDDDTAGAAAQNPGRSDVERAASAPASAEKDPLDAHDTFASAHPAPELLDGGDGDLPSPETQEDSAFFFEEAELTASDIPVAKSIETLDDERIVDLPTQTGLRVRPVIRRNFTSSKLPRPQPWATERGDPPPLFGFACRFSRVRDIETKGEQTFVEPLIWPERGSTRSSKFDARIDDDNIPDRLKDPESDPGPRIRIGGSFADEDEFGLDVTDPTSLSARVEEALELPDVDIDSSEDNPFHLTPRPARPVFLPAPLLVRVDGGTPAVLFDVGTKVPARVSRALASAGAPIVVEVFEGDTALGQISWTGVADTIAEVSFEVEKGGEVFVLVQDLTGQSATARLCTSWMG